MNQDSLEFKGKDQRQIFLIFFSNPLNPQPTQKNLERKSGEGRYQINQRDCKDRNFTVARIFFEIVQFKGYPKNFLFFSNFPHLKNSN